ncbi:hypothetical protein SSP24_25440 [Streptomyces spinoverrucosus]|uniref:Oligosaccharide repeat unit polymerase n=1 Tax=Streptomyces spinoverrucosus TaxID=284043 RepID=A0A4Y3VGS8_9ACTN|nr:hypothetical protein [Streptomyces spinoverrucosus]GEC04889.1 hypothetical protein SSP24_25440 [Streptomyces spinoverrucosus]GHB60428.1 hypothetical protein GCM10010397_33280 [Streptomyces spinoverrucosus]
MCCWFLLLVAMLPTLILYTPEARFGATLAMQCVVVAHAGTALTRVLTDTSVRLVALGFWVFAYVWLGLAPLAMLATDTYPLEYRTGDSTAFAAAALTELGLLAYSGGTALATRSATRRSLVLEPLLSRRLTPWPVLLLCGLSLVLAVIVLPQQEGGLQAFFTSRQALRQSGAEAEDPVRALQVWAVAVPAFWALVALVHLPRRPAGDRLLRGVRWMLLPALLALNVIVNNPISRPRFWAGTVLLVLLFSWRRFSSPRAFRIAAAALTIGVLFVFPYSDYFRYDEREVVEVLSLTEQFSTAMDYDAFQQMQTGIDYVKDNGFSPSAALGPVLFMVPRAIWPDKPQTTGIAFAEYAGYDFHNLSAPLWIETYLWGGGPCVVAAFCLLGLAGRRMDDLRERMRGGHSTLAALLVPAVAFYQLVLLRGSLMAIVGPLLLLLVVPLFITTRPVARSSPSRSPARPPARAGHAPIPGHRRHS